jgi:hypothetical protein
MEQTALEDLITWDVSWNYDDPATTNDNRFVTDQFVNGLLCPSDPGSGVDYGNHGPTSYNLSHGPTATWDVGNDLVVGMFDRLYWCRIANIQDGTSNTIAMAEGRLGTNAGMWDPTKRDPSYRVINTGDLVQSPVNGDARTFTASAVDIATIRTYYDNCLAMYDAGSGWDPANQSDEQGRFWTSATAFRAGYITTLVGPNAGPACDIDASVTNINVKEPSSYHPGGVNALRADASVGFVSETIDQAIWISVGTMSGGEPVQMP